MVTGQEVVILQATTWLAISVLLYRMRRDKYEPTLDFVQAVLMTAGLLISGLLLLLWLLG